MLSSKKTEWIIAGYQLVGIKGFDAVNVEQIARSLEKNKSSFYHYFGESPIYTEALLEYHLSRGHELKLKLEQIENILPDILPLFLEFKEDLLFHKQLRINRSDEQKKRCFENVFTLFENSILKQWVAFLGFENRPMIARTFLHLISENFLLQITESNFTQEWLESYLMDIAKVIGQLSK